MFFYGFICLVILFAVISEILLYLDKKNYKNES